MKNILLEKIQFLSRMITRTRIDSTSNTNNIYMDITSETLTEAIALATTAPGDPTHMFLISIYVITSVLALIALVISYFIIKRRWTRKILSSGTCNLPTVMWLPKFLNYHPTHDDQRQQQNQQQKMKSNDDYCHSTKKMGSSSITNVLPRMERLNGPYGMYATVYGISTKVVHIAHPTPARIVLTGDTDSILEDQSITKSSTNNSSGSSSSSSSSNNSHTAATSTSHIRKSLLSLPNNKKKNNNDKKKKRKGVAYSLGAVKNPAYDHFDNLFGNAVFTADGNEWKSKRASVIHCLLRGCTKDDSKESQRLEMEANRAADIFMNSALLASSSSSSSSSSSTSVNVVKLLQRSTIGLIYRFLTHDEIMNNIPTLSYGDNNYDSTIDDDDSTMDSTTSFSSQSSTFNSSLDSQHSLTATTATAATTNIATKTKALKENFNKRNSNSESKGSNKNNPLNLLPSYLEAITNIRMIILAQSRSIWFLLPRWVYKLFSPMYQEEEKEMKIIRNFASCACLNAIPGSPLHSLRSKKSHCDHHNHSSSTTSSSFEHANKNLLDEAITLLFAGQDTSAATLSWTLHLLSLYPDVQKNLAREVSEALCDYGLTNNDDDDKANISKGIGSQSKYRNIKKKMVIKLPYLDAVLKESMRLYPVAPFVVRNLPDDLMIPSELQDGNNITLPQDSLACIWIYGLHRNKKFWHKPNDFIPERWIDPKLQQLDIGQRNGSFMPFAAGPRNCVGQPLAHVVLRIVLAKIIYVCEFTDHRLGSLRDHCRTDEEIREATLSLRKDMQAGFTVLPTGGVHLNVKQRKIEKRKV